MVWSYTINTDVPGACGLGILTGTYTNTGATTGGAIVTGLHEVLYFKSNYGASAAGTANLTAISGGTVTLTTVAGEDGQWLAIGS